MGLAQIYKGDGIMDKHLYCMLNNGELIPKRKVDDALALFAQLSDGFTVVRLTDEELFANGNVVDAVMLFREKYGTSLSESKDAIDFLRGKEIY